MSSPTLEWMTDSRIEKWRRWCDDEITPDVRRMWDHREAFRILRAISEGNTSLPPSYFYDFVSEVYSTTQAIAVRRQAEQHSRVISLAQLISEIGNDHARFTRQDWRDRWGDPVALQFGLVDAAFTTHYAPDGGDVLDADIPVGDLARLTEVAREVAKYVDQHVAHNDARPAEWLPTFADLNASVDVIGALFEKYSNLLTVSVWTGLVSPMEDDLRTLFSQPWVKPGD